MSEVVNHSKSVQAEPAETRVLQLRRLFLVLVISAGYHDLQGQGHHAANFKLLGGGTWGR
jgi:hypothetical protein